MNPTLVRVLGAGLVLAFGAWLYSATEWVDVPLPPTPDEAVRKDRLFAAKALLRGLGAQVEERKSLDALPPAGATLVLESIHWRLFPERVKALRQFVEAGGHLVIPAHLAARGLRANDGEDDDEESFYLSWIDISIVPVPRADRPPSPSDESVDRPVAQASDPRRRREQCIDRREAAAASARWSPGTISVCSEPDRYSKLAAKAEPRWTLLGPVGPEVMRVPVGRGQVTVTRLEHLHDNDDLLAAGHALVFAATLDLKRGDTVWFVTTEARDSFATLLHRHGLAAMLVGALALALALWRGAARFGPREAVPLPARRSVREQIAGTAAFIAARGGAPLHRAQLRALERSASHHLPGFDRLVAARERAEAIAQATAMDAVALAQAMDGTLQRPARALAAALALLETARRRLPPPSGSNTKARR